jgi:RecA/RadA recombinase
MAKSKQNKTDKLSINNIFKDYVKNEGKGLFEIFDESALTEIKGWISTGNPSLNAILGGSLTRAIPKGRITAFAGRPGVGKSFIIANIIREAQSQGMGVIMFETENAVDRKQLERLGCNCSEILFQPATTITKWQVDVCKVLKDLHSKHPDVEWLVITDSLANLVTDKEIEDTKKGDVKSDQGQRAKQLKAASRMIQKEVAFNNATMVLSNHTYESPGAYPGVPPEEIFTGGQGFIFMCSQIVFLRKYHIKEEIEDLDAVTKKEAKKKKRATGVRVVATIYKNRHVPTEASQGQFYIDFNKGLLKYPGLLSYARKYDFISKKNDQWWDVVGLDKSVHNKEIYEPWVWEPIMESLSQKIEEELKFSSFQDEAMLAELEEASKDTQGEDSNEENDD